MKFNIVNLLYLFFRLAPIIIVAFFSLQLVFNYDVISIIYLIGLIIACLTNMAVGNVFYGSVFKERALQTAARKKELNPMCKVFELTKEGPLSNIPLSQTVLSYSLFFLVLIIFKNDVKTLNWKNTDVKVNPGGQIYKDNIPFFVILPLLIIGDMFWNIKYECDTFQTLVVSLAIGGSIGLAWSTIIDQTYNSRFTGGKDSTQADIGVVGGSGKLRKISNVSASYSTYATGKELDISLFNVINNNVCEKAFQRSIYKCRNIPDPTAIPNPASSGTTPTSSKDTMSDTDKLNKILKGLGTPQSSGSSGTGYTVSIGNKQYNY